MIGKEQFMQNNNSGMGFWGVVLAIIVAVLIMCVL